LADPLIKHVFMIQMILLESSKKSKKNK